MSREPLQDALEHGLRAAYWAIAAVVVGVAVAMMLTMEPSSASQGGRFYVAVIAIVLLGVVDTQLRRLLRRRQPFSLTPTPAERRYAARSLLLLTLVGALLLGLALYLSGSSAEALARIGGEVLIWAAMPLVFVVALKLFGKPLLDHLLRDRG